jgi:hypothetical protein
MATPCLAIDAPASITWKKPGTGCCEYYAPDAETLREAYHTAKVKFARVWPAMLFEGDAPPDTQPGAS